MSIPLILTTQIDRLLAEKSTVIVAIDGGSAAGKTTLAYLLSQTYDCNIFHMDSFFLQAQKRTEERLSQPGGNVDYERFQSAVLQNIQSGGDFSYRPYNCKTLTLDEPIFVKAKQLNIVEGVYSTHPELSAEYNFAVFLDINKALQRERIVRRNGADFGQRFFDEWMPLEGDYFDKMNVAKRCDVVLNAADIAFQ